MKDQRNQRGRTTSSHGRVVSRFFFISAFLGLLIGLCEAAMLWTTPRIIPLLVPDVGWVIWFLAPLVDMIFFALVGLGVGLLAKWISGREILVAVWIGVVATFLDFMAAWFHEPIGLRPFHFKKQILAAFVVFALGFIVSLPILVVTWRRLADFSERRVRALLEPLAWGLAGATVAAVVGIGIFVLWPPLSGQASPPTVPAPSSAPNIVFITLDTVRADHLSSYGYSRPTTPNIDRFARTGVLFENAIAPTSWTLASHASMFTGLLPQQHGADFVIPLQSSPWTLAEILRSQGYQTVGIIANSTYLEKGWGIAQGFGRYEDQSISFQHNLSDTLLGTVAVQLVYQRFIRFDYFWRENASRINERVFRSLSHRPQRPFFLFINYFDVHDPYFAPGSFGHRFGRAPTDLYRSLSEAIVSQSGFGKFGQRDRDLLIDDYDNCLAYLDDQVGKLLHFLRQSPQWQNTVIIITSDHGDEFGEHGSYYHGQNLYREVLHVPLVIAGPGIPKDMRISHLVGTRELFSTILDLAGRGHTPFSRTSLARFWNPGFKPGPSDNTVVSELVPQNQGPSGTMISLTTPRWQFIEHRDGRQELYEWTIDHRERDNLAASPAEQATLGRLRSNLINLVSNATGPWLGPQYLQALDLIKGPARLSLLHPRPLQQDGADNSFRIGIAQAFFRPDESTPIRPSQSERDLMRSLPYQ